jgi:hypothetical protein
MTLVILLTLKVNNILWQHICGAYSTKALDIALRANSLDTSSENEVS